MFLVDFKCMCIVIIPSNVMYSIRTTNIFELSSRCNHDTQKFEFE